MINFFLWRRKNDAKDSHTDIGCEGLRRCSSGGPVTLVVLSGGSTKLWSARRETEDRVMCKTLVGPVTVVHLSCGNHH